MKQQGRPFSTSAIVARRVEFRESDLICTLLTAAQGKISALARGARRSRKRFGGSLSLFVIGEASLREPGRGDLFQLEHFDCVEDLGSSLSIDMIKMAHGSYMLEVTRELMPTAQPEPACFSLLCEALRALAALSAPSPCLLRAFELKLLRAVGLEPSLDRCVRCDAPAQPTTELLFNVEQGGLVCANCGPGGWPMDPPTRQAMLELRDVSIKQAHDANHPPAVARQLRELMMLTVRHHLGKDLRSLDFLVQLSGWKQSSH